MCRKILVLLPLAVAALVFTGCDGGKASMGSEEANLLGFVKLEKESYEPTSPTTFAIHSDELYTRRNFSGDKHTFLWGLVTIKDY